MAECRASRPIWVERAWSLRSTQRTCGRGLRCLAPAALELFLDVLAASLHRPEVVLAKERPQHGRQVLHAGLLHDGPPVELRGRAAFFGLERPLAPALEVAGVAERDAPRPGDDEDGQRPAELVREQAAGDDLRRQARSRRPALPRHLEPDV